MNNEIKQVVVNQTTGTPIAVFDDRDAAVEWLKATGQFRKCLILSVEFNPQAPTQGDPQ